MDLGCGNGIATVVMARFRAPAVGLDIARDALVQARGLAREAASPATFVVAEVPFVPLRDGAVSLLFDRGCLLHVRSSRWRRYFREAARVLKPGGALQLFVPRPVRHTRRARVAGALRAALGRRPVERYPRPRTMRRLLPPELDLAESREFPFRGARGLRRSILYVLIRRR